LRWLERALDKREVPGSIPGRPTSGACVGDVAQLGEHLLCKQGVAGSNPVISTRRESTGIVAGLTRCRSFTTEYEILECSQTMFSQWSLFVVKLLRANGGWLFGRERRTTWA